MSAPRTLGVRNFNCGNIEFGPFARRYGGVLGEGGRFAKFPDMATGFRAIAELLQAYYAKVRADRIDTIQEVVSTWAPSNENNVKAYVADVCRETGLRANDRIDLNDYATLWWLAYAIAKHECGADSVAAYVTDDDISIGTNAALV